MTKLTTTSTNSPEDLTQCRPNLMNYLNDFRYQKVRMWAGKFNESIEGNDDIKYVFKNKKISKLCKTS